MEGENMENIERIKSEERKKKEEKERIKKIAYSLEPIGSFQPPSPLFFKDTKYPSYLTRVRELCDSVWCRTTWFRGGWLINA